MGFSTLANKASIQSILFSIILHTCIEHKHLPGIKPGAEIIEEGLSLGELSVQILEKIEELTLHVIDMDRKTAELSERSEEIQKELELFEIN